MRSSPGLRSKLPHAIVCFFIETDTEVASRDFAVPIKSIHADPCVVVPHPPTFLSLLIAIPTGLLLLVQLQPRQIKFKVLVTRFGITNSRCWMVLKIDGYWSLLRTYYIPPSKPRIGKIRHILWDFGNNEMNCFHVQSHFPTPTALSVFDAAQNSPFPVPPIRSQIFNV